jgi:3-oxoacyl-[acyl-carrier protein] reductase
VKNALITGVSRGLGLKAAKKFISMGWNVYGISRSTTDDLYELKTGGKLFHKQFDLLNIPAIKKEIFKNFINNQIPIHAVIHNAAIAYDEIATNSNYDKLNNMFQVNVLAPIMMNNYSIKNMLYNQVKGSFVFVSSISSTTGYKGLSMYASTKGALESHCKNLAREWGPRGIRFNCVVPGFMQTEMSKGLTDEQRNKIYNRTCLKKETNIDSVIDTIYFLCSDGANSITGEKIHVDNGTV